MRYARTRPERDFGLIFGDGDRMVAALPRYRTITKTMPTRLTGTLRHYRYQFQRPRHENRHIFLPVPLRSRFFCSVSIPVLSNKPFVIASSDKNRFCIFFTYRKYLLILIWHQNVCYLSYMTISLVVGLP